MAEHRWTKTHGFFALMGGFRHTEGDERPHTLTLKELNVLSPDGSDPEGVAWGPWYEPVLVSADDFTFPKITEGEIKRRSKGDMLSKGLVVLQTTWFILQCIARWAEHLPVTELEIVTLAFAILNIVTYALWWNKPLNVECPAVLYKRKSEVVKSGRMTVEDDVPQGDRERQRRTAWFAIMCTIWVRVRAVGRTPAAIGHAIHSAANFVTEAIEEHGWKVILLPIEAVIFPFIAMAGDDYDDINGPFYSGELIGGEGYYVAFAGGLVATMFGGIHCIAWSFQFPTHTEQILWRVSSLAITCVPVLEVGLWKMFDSLHLPKRLNDVLSVLGGTIIATALLLHIAARLILLVLAFMSLRVLPPGAYQTVHWVTFIPHI